jgi:hypothetical protein
VPDNDGTGGEFLVIGRAVEVIDDPAARARVAATARYAPKDRYLLFELRPTAARCNGYGDVALPPRTRWPFDA